MLKYTNRYSFTIVPLDSYAIASFIWLEVAELLVRPALLCPLHPLCPDGRTPTPQNPYGTGEDCL